jgi:valyl-tRNA synthetase
MDGMPTYTKTDFSKITENLDLQLWLKNNFKSLHPVNQWILTRFDRAIEVVEGGLENFKLNESSNELYSFIWNEYCDWYIEFSKVLLENPKTANETQICLMYLLQDILKLAHPFIPFITEEIYQNLPERPSVQKGESIMISQFPSKLNLKMSADADGFVQTARTSIEAIRAFRGENNIHPKARPELTYEKIGVQSEEKWMEQATSIICVLSQIQSLKKENGGIKGSDTSAEIISSHFKFYVPMNGLIDVAEELKRVEKQVADVKKDIEHVKNKLSKETFISKAPADLVAAEKQKIEQFNIKLIELEKTRSKLSKLK